MRIVRELSQRALSSQYDRAEPGMCQQGTLAGSLLQMGPRYNLDQVSLHTLESSVEILVMEKRGPYRLEISTSGMLMIQGKGCGQREQDNCRKVQLNILDELFLLVYLIQHECVRAQKI